MKKLMIIALNVFLCFMCISCEKDKSSEVNKKGGESSEEQQGSEPKESKDYVILRDLRLVVKVFEDGERLSYSNAERKCNQLSLGGYDDWRLPTISELMNINAYTTLLKGQNQWWSSSPYYYDSETYHYCLDKGNAVVSVDGNMWWVVAVIAY